LNTQGFESIGFDTPLYAFVQHLNLNIDCQVVQLGVA